MKSIRIILFSVLLMQQSTAQYNDQRYPPYSGTDLGMHYQKNATRFRIWSPPASTAELRLYREGDGGTAERIVPMQRSLQGTWVATISGDINNWYYTFRVQIDGQWSNEVTDPYAIAAGVNGKRAMVVDLASTNPSGWQLDRSPAFSATNKATDAIIYELHVRDASVALSSGIEQKGKFLGLAETNTKNAQGQSTGLDHLKSLGVTHIHLLPFFDYNSVDETKSGQYNWGYDPVHYNLPEGSYATDANNGNTRIRELKQMIQAFHKNGLRVVMDAVYNHTALTATSNFNQLVPGYYYRQKADGSFSDATACGNETASERTMFRKFMLESVLYWVKEYHIDGFRFDLMGVHDIETMNLLSDTLHKIKPDILLYGEGWTAGASPLPESQRAVKKNAHLLKGIAVFSDDVRDGIKGSVFSIPDRGFATGKTANAESVKFGVVAAVNHPQIDFNKVNYSKSAYSAGPANVITYCECHDNHILWDKIQLSYPDAGFADRKQMQQLAFAIVLTSQGIPFLHAGSEFLRSKQGAENSYNKGDGINAIDWGLKWEHRDVFAYVQQLINMRKAHPAFRLSSADAINKHIRFQDNLPEGLIAYTIDGTAVKDAWKKILVAFNGTGNSSNLTLPAGHWKAALDGAHPQKYQGSMRIPAYGAVILYHE